MKNCKDCPSYLSDPIDIRKRFKRPSGVAMCGRHGFILGSPRHQDDKDESNMLATFAEECADYGQPLPATPVNFAPRVAEPNIELLSEPTGIHLDSCHGCANLVKHSSVYDVYGWALPLCKATGNLIFEPTKVAPACSVARPGMPTETTVDITLRKELRSNYRMNDTKVVARTVAALAVDPGEYRTDASVSPEDQADGIRAWRKVTDPTGSDRSVMLPIFDPEFFTPTEREFIPKTGDDHHPELYVDYANLLWKFAVDQWTLNETLLLQSDPGLGKTEFTYWLAWLMQVPHRRIAFKGSSEYEEVFGKMMYKPERGTYWQDGRFTRAWRSHACILCVDEPNLARNEIIESLRTTTDTDRMLYLDGASSENEEGEDDERVLMIAPGPYVFPIWCMNPTWDIRNVGTKEVANADVDRLTPAVVPYPPEPLERHIIRERCKVVDGFDIPEDKLDALIKVAADIREMAAQGDFPGSWGMRQQIKVARKLAWYSFEEAFRMAALNYYEPEVAEMVINNSIKLTYNG